MKTRRLLASCIAGCLWLVSGCMKGPALDPDSLYKTFKAQGHWQGRVLARYQHRKAVILDFDYEKMPEKGWSFRLWSPWGESVVALLQQTEPRRARALLKDQIGFDFPVENLGFWLQGMPNPHLAHRALRRVPEGGLSFLQAGCHVTWRVGRLEIKRHGAILTVAWSDGDAARLASERQRPAPFHPKGRQ